MRALEIPAIVVVAVEGVEPEVAGLLGRLDQSDNRRHRDAGPGGHRGPALDTVMLDGVGLARQGLDGACG